MPERNTNDIATLLAEAIHLAPSERAAFLDAACNGNSNLRRDLEDLLAAHDQAGDFLQRAAIPTGIVHAAETLAPQHEEIGTRIGPYKILQLIGEGGFGSVYMAEQEHPVRRRVALKVIKLGMDTRQVIARFEAERQALAIMDHPSIARVFDAGATANGRPYFVMELVKGEPITEYCDRNRLPLNQRLALFQQVCAAVQHAHQKGVIHRDIKPSNVLVTLHDGQPTPKVIDFGIAKATSSRLTDKTLFTEFRQLIGTPEYMSPEQSEANATDVDTRADVYSLGVLLYELLTGSTPFDSRRLRSAAFGEMQRIIREEDPPKPSTRVSTIDKLPTVASQRAMEPTRLRSELRGDLDWIVMRAIEKDRTRRYESASALADDVRRHINHEPVHAGSPGATYRLRKFIRRNRAQAVAATLIALALIGGSIGTLIGMLRARDAATHAREEAAKSLAINDFLSDVLTSVEPDEKGADVRLMEVMDDASRTAPQRFAGHPELEADLRQTLSQVYLRLSNHPAAKAELEKALAIWQQVAGSDDRRTLATHLGIASLCIGREQTSQAEAILKQVTPRIVGVFPADSAAAIELQWLEGMIDLQRRRYDDADAKLLAARRKIADTGDADAEQLKVLDGLIQVQWRRLHESNETDPAILKTIEPLIREIIDRATRVRGPDAMLTMDSRLRLADIQWQTGQCRSAVEACRSVLASSKDRFGDCHNLRDTARFVLGLALSRLGEAAEAAERWQERIDCFRQAGRSRNDPFYLSVVSDAMRMFDHAQRYAEGEVIAKEVAAALRALGGGHDDMAIEAEQYVAHFASMQGRLDEADSLFAPLLANSHGQSQSSIEAGLRMFHARHLVKRGQFEEAEADLKMATDMKIADRLPGNLREGTYTTHPYDLAQAHANLYVAWGKPELAADYQSVCHEILAQAVAGETDPGHHSP